MSAEESVPTTERGWFAADTSDGACHYGERDASGSVHAACGAVFTPIRNPYTK